jgi:hypothetical protein
MESTKIEILVDGSNGHDLIETTGRCCIPLHRIEFVLGASENVLIDFRTKRGKPATAVIKRTEMDAVAKAWLKARKEGKF